MLLSRARTRPSTGRRRRARTACGRGRRSSCRSSTEALSPPRAVGPPLHARRVRGGPARSHRCVSPPSNRRLRVTFRSGPTLSRHVGSRGSRAGSSLLRGCSRGLRRRVSKERPGQDCLPMHRKLSGPSGFIWLCRSGGAMLARDDAGSRAHGGDRDRKSPLRACSRSSGRVVIDSDAIGTSSRRRDPLLAEIARGVGSELLRADGSLDRAASGAGVRGSRGGARA